MTIGKPRVLRGQITPSAPQTAHILASDASCNEKFATYAYVDTWGRWRMAIMEWSEISWPYRHVNLTEFWAMYHGLQVALTPRDHTDSDKLTVYTDNTHAARIARAWINGRKIMPTWYTTKQDEHKLLIARGNFRSYKAMRPVQIEWVSRRVQYPPHYTAHRLSQLALRLAKGNISIDKAYKRASLQVHNLLTQSIEVN